MLLVNFNYAYLPNIPFQFQPQYFTGKNLPSIHLQANVKLTGRAGCLAPDSGSLSTYRFTPMPPRPHTTVILAMSADGKIADAHRSAPQFGSANDKYHLEWQVAQADGVLAGATTLRAGGTAMRVMHPELLRDRENQGKPPQPVQIVCTRSGELDPQLRFFRQPVPRWLLTTAQGAERWHNQPGFDQILALETPQQQLDWQAAFAKFATLGLAEIAVLGGGEIVAALLAEDLIDNLWLTVCPLLLGGSQAPTPVEGEGFPQAIAPRLQLLEVRHLEQEVFLHYRLQR